LTYVATRGIDATRVRASERRPRATDAQANTLEAIACLGPGRLSPKRSGTLRAASSRKPSRLRGTAAHPPGTDIGALP
jgi:hypothetical protein